MRILFTFAGGSGHADPLVPVASAMRAAGHRVAFAGRRTGASVAEATGITVLADPIGDDAVTVPLRAPDMEHEYRVLRTFYAGEEARRRSGVISELITSWRPDLLVCDEVDFGAAIAAERSGVPHATVLVTASGSFVRAEVVAEAVGAVRLANGLPPDPYFAMPGRHLTISPFPPSFRDPTFALPPRSVSIRPGAVEAPGDDARALRRLPARRRPTVYCTLGTVFNTESGDLFERLLSALRDLPIEVVMTVGRNVDPVRFGPQPDHVRIERFIAQSTILPRCDLVINHGGSGSVIGALAHGLPLVVIPMGADQSLNAARCEQIGVGVTLDAVGATQETISRAVIDMIGSPQRREAAERISDEISALPGPESTVPLLEGLVSDAR